MLIEVTHTPVTEKGREIVQGASSDYQYTAMIADLNQYDGHATPWHWHEHYEVGYVKSGRMTLCTQRQNISINEGEGYFLNANVLHHSISATSSPLELQAQLFDKTILTGARQVVRRYMTSVDNCFRLDAIKLTYASENDATLLDEIRAAFEAAKADDGGELLVAAHLNVFWHHLIRRITPILMEKPEPEPRDSIRMKQMLTFIHLHFAEHISIEQVAREAGICERECYRCFSKALDMTPVAYINGYRVQVACQKLLETDLSIAAISDECGFSSSSYFVNVFKRSTGCTPVEYRKRR